MNIDIFPGFSGAWIYACTIHICAWVKKKKSFLKHVKNILGETKKLNICCVIFRRRAKQI